MRIESSSLPAFRGRGLMPFHAGGSIAAEAQAPTLCRELALALALYIVSTETAGQTL